MGLFALNLLASVCLLCSLVLVLQASRRVWETTLRTAATWALVGLLSWSVAFVMDLWLAAWSDGSRDLLWYLTVVICACPPVAVLGARRPGAAAWAFFVLLPLLLVLLWPAVAATRVWQVGVPLELEEPALVAFAVVLVMGCGNYFGTKFTLPVLLFFIAIVLVLAPMSAVAPDFLRHQRSVRAWGTILLSVAIGLARLRCTAVASFDEAWNGVWLDFTDHFGLVWAKRVMERLNESARHEHWVAKLEWHGFVWQVDATAADRAATRERIDHTLRWLLKRFVEPTWIDQRLSP